jgi:hypothetical protein
MRSVLSCAVLGLALVCASVAGAAEADKPAKKPVGTWARDAGGRTLTFTFKEDGLTIKLEDGSGNGVTVSTAYGVTGETVFGVVTKVEKKGTEGGPEKGDLFSFSVKVNKDVLTLGDLKGTNTSEENRKLVEGEYKKK